MTTRRTTFADITTPDCEARPFVVVRSANPFGRKWIDFACPWCASNLRAYVWSLAGSGKRCECGAVFGSGGKGYKLKETKQ